MPKRCAHAATIFPTPPGAWARSWAELHAALRAQTIELGSVAEDKTAVLERSAETLRLGTEAIEAAAAIARTRIDEAAGDVGRSARDLDATTHQAVARLRDGAETLRQRASEADANVAATTQRLDATAASLAKGPTRPSPRSTVLPHAWKPAATSPATRTNSSSSPPISLPPVSAGPARRSARGDESLVHAALEQGLDRASQLETAIAQRAQETSAARRLMARSRASTRRPIPRASAGSR